MRTTSSLEAMNSQLNRLFAEKHPNIFCFVEYLKYHEYSEAQKMLDLVSADMPEGLCERVRERDRSRDKKIKYYSGLLRMNAISVKKFLKVIGIRSPSLFYYCYNIPFLIFLKPWRFLHHSREKNMDEQWEETRRKKNIIRWMNVSFQDLTHLIYKIFLMKYNYFKNDVRVLIFYSNTK